MNVTRQKSQFSNFLVNWGKFGSKSRLFKSPNFASLLKIEDQTLNLWMNWGKLCPRLSLSSLLKIRWRIHMENDVHILNLT